ncbi:hypothetical protein C8R43DRAFT_965490 [Mycena crocata]|nr:hypothetical protein C8R43DRAFT_965490 [Mycena crocata]
MTAKSNQNDEESVKWNKTDPEFKEYQYWMGAVTWSGRSNKCGDQREHIQGRVELEETEECAMRVYELREARGKETLLGLELLMWLSNRRTNQDPRAEEDRQGRIAVFILAAGRRALGIPKVDDIATRGYDRERGLKVRTPRLGCRVWFETIRIATAGTEAAGARVVRTRYGTMNSFNLRGRHATEEEGARVAGRGSSCCGKRGRMGIPRRERNQRGRDGQSRWVKRRVGQELYVAVRGDEHQRCGMGPGICMEERACAGDGDFGNDMIIRAQERKKHPLFATFSRYRHANAGAERGRGAYG